MTTAVEARVLPKAYAKAKPLCGAPVTFTLYPSAVPDTDESTVALGASVPHLAYITPPEGIDTELSQDSSETERERIAFYVLTGALTAEAIDFVPAVGQTVTVRGLDWFVRSVKAQPSGDHIPTYYVEARR